MVKSKYFFFIKNFNSNLIIYILVTEKLLRKKSEHNDLIISTLTEITLHQEDIEKIENIQNWCRDLTILLLQNNLISKIENLHKLKKLEYLNLAINNIEIIENLEKLESLQKLDLTLNFIGELTSIGTLSDNYNLEELTLTGNPCTNFYGYRDYVIVTLPQLKRFDSEDVTRTERLQAIKKFPEIKKKIIQSEIEYKIKRDEQKIRVEMELKQHKLEVEGLDEDEQNKRFWEQKSEHCPEIRNEISKVHQRCRKEEPKPETKEKRKIKLFAECGRPYSLNEPKIDFSFNDEDDRYELNLKIYKFLDTSLVEVDLQTSYVRVDVKGKIFQMALKEEVKISESTSKRSLITGHLLIVMPKLNYKKKVTLICCNKKSVENCKEVQLRAKENNLKSCVNYKNIVFDESEVPPLI